MSHIVPLSVKNLTKMLRRMKNTKTRLRKLARANLPMSLEIKETYHYPLAEIKKLVNDFVGNLTLMFLFHLL